MLANHTPYFSSVELSFKRVLQNHFNHVEGIGGTFYGVCCIGCSTQTHSDSKLYLAVVFVCVCECVYCMQACTFFTVPLVVCVHMLHVYSGASEST